MEIDIKRVAEKICNENKGITLQNAENYARSILADLDERLVPNLHEWLDGKEISDIWIGKYCIGAIMSIHGDQDFLSALEAMNVYLHDEEKGIFLIWKGRK